MQLRPRFRCFVPHLLKDLLGAGFILPSGMGISLGPQNLAQPHHSFCFTISVAVLPASIERLLVHLAGFEDFAFDEQRIAQTSLGQRHAVVIANFPIDLESLLGFLQGPANVPQIKSNLAQIVKLSGDTVHIPDALMDRQRFLIPLTCR